MAGAVTKARTKTRAAEARGADETHDDRPALAQRDGVWMAGVAAVAALIFASTFSSAVAGGDAPESVAGVASIGAGCSPVQLVGAVR